MESVWIGPKFRQFLYDKNETNVYIIVLSTSHLIFKIETTLSNKKDTNIERCIFCTISSLSPPPLAEKKGKGKEKEKSYKVKNLVFTSIQCFIVWFQMMMIIIIIMGTKHLSYLSWTYWSNHSHKATRPYFHGDVFRWYYGYGN